MDTDLLSHFAAANSASSGDRDSCSEDEDGHTCTDTDTEGSVHQVKICPRVVLEAEITTGHDLAAAVNGLMAIMNSLDAAGTPIHGFTLEIPYVDKYVARMRNNRYPLPLRGGDLEHT